MKHSSKTASILGQLHPDTNLGDLRKIAKAVKTDHETALELWSAGGLHPRLLAILIMDHKQVTPALIDQMDKDMHTHSYEARNQLMDWFMANQLMKNKKSVALIESWEDSLSALQRRVFWYQQARLRWMGQEPPPNTAELLAKIEAKIADEAPEVQWPMNFTAGWIGVFAQPFRERCVAIGEKTGLYKGDKVSKGCTPDYLPEFIAIESRKRNL